MTHTNLFYQNKLVFQKLDAIMNSELACLLITCMLCCAKFVGQKFAYFFGLRPFQKYMMNYGQKLN